MYSRRVLFIIGGASVLQSPWGKLGVCLSRHVGIEVKCYYHFSFVVLIQRICIFWPYMTKGGEQDIPFLAQYDDFLSFMNRIEIP